MSKTNKHKAPSRIKYEQSHPTISCRVPRDIYDRLKAANNLGSFGDILEKGLGLAEANDQKLRKYVRAAYEKAYDECFSMFETMKKEQEEAIRLYYDKGYEKGYTEAQNLYMVEYPCCVCGGRLIIHSETEKKAAGKFLQEQGWAHSECDPPE